MGAAFINWLVSLGLLKTVLATVVATGVGSLLSWRPWRRRAARRPQRDELVEQAEGVGTQTLHNVVSQLNRILAEREHPRG